MIGALLLILLFNMALGGVLDTLQYRNRMDNYEKLAQKYIDDKPCIDGSYMTIGSFEYNKEGDVK